MCRDVSLLISFYTRCLLLALFVLAAALPESAECNSWRVIPIRIDMDQRTRSGVITIVNDSDDPLSFSVDAREWTQDINGYDQYTETTDILYFPKNLTVGPRSERIIRAGIKVPAVSTEKTYRLFIKQETDPDRRSATAVAIVIRFGVPIFSKPLQETFSGEITQSMVTEDTFALSVKNNGNSHFRVQTVKLNGTDSNGMAVWSHELSGAYLLAGTEQTFTTDLPDEICSQLNALAIEVVADRVQLNGQIDVDKAMCLKP